MDNRKVLEKAIQKAIDGGWPTILASTMVIADDPIAYLGEHIDG